MSYGTDTHMFARVAVAVASGLVLFYVVGWIAILAVVAIAFVIIRNQEMVALKLFELQSAS